MIVCHVCSSNKLTTMFYLNRHEIAECQSCFSLNNLSFKKHTPGETFDDYYYENTQSNAFNIQNIGENDKSHKIYLKGLQLITNYFPDSQIRILDVGAGFGSFVKTALDAGFQAQGIEISKYSSQVATNIGLPVENKEISELLGNTKFNVITYWDVIEHVTGVGNNLVSANKLLLDDGLILFTTDNYDSLIVDVGKFLYYFLNWKWPLGRYLIPENTVYFTPSTLLYIMNLNGFELIHHEQIDYPIEKINLNIFNRAIVRALYHLGFRHKRQSQFLSIYRKK